MEEGTPREIITRDNVRGYDSQRCVVASFTAESYLGGCGGLIGIFATHLCSPRVKIEPPGINISLMLRVHEWELWVLVHPSSPYV